MFSKTITLTASKEEFVFSDGQRESRFRPVVYLAPDTKKILAVGSAPTGGKAYLTVDIFREQEPVVDAFSILESMFRFGVRSLVSGFISPPPSLRIAIAADIRAELKGFASSVFRAAATGAGARKVEIHEEKA